MSNRLKWPLLTSCVLFFSAAQAEDAGKPLAEFKPELTDEFKVLLGKADLSKGEMSFMRKCSSCHDHEKNGGHGKGPHLWNVMGRKAGSAPGFEYSTAMANSGHTWNWATLNYYLTNTEQAVPGRAMNFRGIRRDSARADLLLFLASLNDKPQVIP
jgi:cytochrome c